MDTADHLSSALAALSDRALLALRAGIVDTPDAVAAPGLIAFMEHAVDWEADRRTGRHYPLQGPRAAIDDGEVDVSLVALAVLAEKFREGGEIDSAEVTSFLEISAATLRAEVERPGVLQ